MKRNGSTEEQIIGILKGHQAGCFGEGHLPSSRYKRGDILSLARARMAACAYQMRSGYGL